MQVVIIEDELPAARMLQRKVEAEGLQVVAMMHGVAQSLAWFTENPLPDLVFMDIQLSDGLSFDLFEPLQLQVPIIFTTAYDQYAIKAFKVNAIDYLLKPIDTDELRAAIHKYRQGHRPAAAEVSQWVQALQQQLSTGPVYKKRFSIRVGQHLKLIDIGEVSAFYAENKGVYLRTREGRDYLIDSPLDQLEKQLDPNAFFRINRKIIVAFTAITDIQWHSNTRFKLYVQAFDPSDDWVVSRERTPDFKQWLDAE